MTVAETILNQLGGRKFIVMTGSKVILSDYNSITFKFYYIISILHIW